MADSEVHSEQGDALAGARAGRVGEQRSESGGG